MTGFSISELPASSGYIALCPMPGACQSYNLEINELIAWQPDLVVTLTQQSELDSLGAANLPGDLIANNCDWLHLPVRDFAVPAGKTLAAWSKASAQICNTLANGGRVLVHCRGGCGRAGMAVLRILIELGEPPDRALERLRAVRKCAVETDAQMRWAMT